MKKKMHGLIDIGANLTHSAFEADFEDVVTAAKAAELTHIILTGTDMQTSEAAAKLAGEHPSFFSSTAGFHPHISQHVNPVNFALLKVLLQNPAVVAIGETGLDYNRNYSEPQMQRRVFEAHLELACTVRKPLFLHQRDAHTEFLEMLSAFRAKISGGVVHCFTDSHKALKEYLDLGMYIGITGWICDERRGKTLQDIVTYIPHDRLLIETDAPYLLPRSLRPKPKSRRNEPKYLTEVLGRIAACRNEDANWLRNVTAQNACTLFQLNNKVLSHTEHSEGF